MGRRALYALISKQGDSRTNHDIAANEDRNLASPIEDKTAAVNSLSVTLLTCSGFISSRWVTENVRRKRKKCFLRANQLQTAGTYTSVWTAYFLVIVPNSVSYYWPTPFREAASYSANQETVKTCFYANRRLATVFTKPRHWTLLNHLKPVHTL